MGLRNRNLLAQERCFFVTTSCYHHFQLLSLTGNYHLLAENIIHYSSIYDVKILGYVFMPNHIHLVVYFETKNQLSPFMRDFKKFSAYQIRKKIDEVHPEWLSKLLFEKKMQRFKIWADRFDDLFVAKAKTLVSKLNYIHANPLQKHWQLAEDPIKYEW